MALADQFGHPLRIVLLDDDPAYADDLARRLHRSANLRLLGNAVREQDLAGLVADLVPDILFIDFGLPHRSGLDVAERAARRYPGIPVVLLADEPTNAIWREAVARGARTVVRKDVPEPDLAALVREVFEAEAKQLSRLAAEGSSDTRGRPAFARTAPQVVAVYSPKGGVGKSTIATNLAVWLQANPFERLPVALCDLEKGVGTTNTLLGMPAQPTLLDWRDYAGEAAVDPAVVKTHVAEHPSTGLHCVFSPGAYRSADDVGMALARTVLRSVQMTHAVTVADCGPDLTDAVGVALELATVVLLVVEVTAPTIGKVKHVAAELDAAGLSLSKFRLVLNRLPPNPDWSAGQIQEALPFPVLGRLREDPQVARAANRMKVAAQAMPGGLFMQGVREIADKLVPGTGYALSERRVRRGIWSLWHRGGERA